MAGHYANSAGRMGPATYRDPPEPDEHECPECGSMNVHVEGDKHEGRAWCDDCGYATEKTL